MDKISTMERTVEEGITISATMSSLAGTKELAMLEEVGLSERGRSVEGVASCFCVIGRKEGLVSGKSVDGVGG